MLYLYALSGFLLAGGLVAWHGRERGQDRVDITRQAACCGVLAACLIRFGLLFILSRRGNVIYDCDEQTRYMTALRWMHKPTFSTHGKESGSPDQPLIMAHGCAWPGMRMWVFLPACFSATS